MNRIVLSITVMVMLNLHAIAQEVKVFKAQKLNTGRISSNEKLTKYQLYQFEANQVYDYVQQKSKGAAVSFKLFFDADYQWQVTIQSNDVRTKNFVIRTRQGIQQVVKESHTYQGHIAGNPGSVVRMSVYRNRIFGMIISSTGEPTFFETVDQISNARTNNLVQLYEAHNISHKFKCGVKGENKVKAPKIGTQNHRTQACEQAPIALGVDLASFELENRDMSVLQARLQDYINGVNGLYQSLEIQYTISEVYVSTDGSESWTNTSNDNDTRLRNFRSWGQTNFTKDFAVATLWAGGTSSGYGFVEVVCGSYKYNLTPYDKNGGTTIILNAHELGHNWGASHASDRKYIMNPTVFSSSTSWSTTSQSVILATKGKVSCLQPCSSSSVAPTITSFTPVSGRINTKVVITGSNFSDVVGNNTVAFNGTNATINEATTTELKVTVPTGATTGRITVMVGGQTATSAQDFRVTGAINNPGPSIISFTPNSGTVNTEVVITGSNYSDVVSNNTVAFNGTNATINEATTTELKVSVPMGATTGRITVVVGGQTATSSQDFRVIEEINVNNLEINPSNIITPNNDSRNDVWQIQGIDQVNDYEVMVFSKAGQVVFKTSNYTTPWNGTFNGKPLPSGVYYYNIVVNVRGAKVKKTGYVTLIR
ncbi:MAG TPA: hypothetical protein DCS93_23555 [Microscillaceae bacterium]|nr:hypothetical protein [Microscillaceae bacterium]